MPRHRSWAARVALLMVALCWRGTSLHAQALTQRGFADGLVTVFPQDAPADAVNTIGDVLVREEVFARPASWLRLAAGFDVRFNTNDQVDQSWRVDISDRGIQRPAISVRRLSATLTRGPLTVDVGKQFIRWGKTDIVTPTDRFAPRDFVNVVNTEFLGVSGVRGVLQRGAHAIDLVWLPVFTPSRIPLLNQRWAPVPPDLRIQLTDAGAAFPTASQLGVRYTRIARRLEYALSVYNGSNHLPTIDLVPLPVGATVNRTELSPPAESALTVGVRRRYADMQSYGADIAMPTRWLTIKAEAAYAQSGVDGGDDYVLYVVQIERQTGEWQLVGGYAGEVVTKHRTAATFAPDRGLTRSIVARASYTIGPNRGVAFEGAARQNGHGVYARAEYSQARGQHWRTTVAGLILAGRADDFLGQYNRNSQLSVALRYSF